MPVFRAFRKVSAIHRTIAQLAYRKGARAAISLIFPLIFAVLLRDDRFAWAALGCFEAHLCEDGGSNRVRRRIFGTLIVFGAAGSFLGTLAGSFLLTGLPMTFCWLFVCTLSVQLGKSFAACSTAVIVLYLGALGYPSTSIFVAFERTVFTGAGILWAAAFSSFVWQISPYRHARQAIAACYRELFAFLEELSVLSHGGESSLHIWDEVTRLRHNALHELLDSARETTTAIRLGRRRESDLGDQLVYLVESADYAFRLTGAFSRSLRQQVERYGHYRRVLPAKLWEALTLEQQIANHLAASPHRGNPTPGDPSMPVSQGGEEQYRALHALVDVLREASTFSLAISLDDRRFGRFSAKPEERQPIGIVARERSDRWPAILQSVTGRSEEFHSALRIGTACCIDLMLTLVFPVQHSHWLTLASIIVLQPGMTIRFRSSSQRILAAVAGGFLAAGVGITMKSRPALSIVAVLPAFAAVALPLTAYSWLALLLTRLLFLLPLDRVNDFGVAGTLALHTMLGTFVASAAMYLLWPVREYRQFSEQVLITVRRIHAYLQTLVEVSQLPSAKALPSMAPYMNEARRSSNLELNNLEEALQRLLFARSEVEFGALMAPIVCLRQLTWTITATLHRIDENDVAGESSRETLKRLLHLLSKMESRIEGRSFPARPERRLHRNSVDRSATNVSLSQMERQILLLARVLSRSRWLWTKDQRASRRSGQTA